MGSNPPEMYTRQSLARLMTAPEVTVLTTFDPAISTAIGFVPVVEWATGLGEPSGESCGLDGAACRHRPEGLSGFGRSQEPPESGGRPKESCARDDAAGRR
jgi:hypothetical protein